MLLQNEVTRPHRLSGRKQIDALVPNKFRIIGGSGDQPVGSVGMPSLPRQAQRDKGLRTQVGRSQRLDLLARVRSNRAQILTARSLPAHL